MRNKKADEHQGHNVKEGDAPEDLLDGAGEGFARIGCFCCCEADEFGAGEGEA